MFLFFMPPKYEKHFEYVFATLWRSSEHISENDEINLEKSGVFLMFKLSKFATLKTRFSQRNILFEKSVKYSDIFWKRKSCALVHSTLNWCAILIPRCLQKVSLHFRFILRNMKKGTESELIAAFASDTINIIQHIFTCFGDFNHVIKISRHFCM